MNKWKIALVISLVTNIFIVGAVAGAFGARVRDQQQMRGGRSPGVVGGNPMMRAGDRLPEAERMAFREAVRRQGGPAQPYLREAREGRLEAARVLAADPYDRAAALAAFARARTADMKARESLETAVVEFAAGLGADNRRALAQGLREPPRGGRGGGRGRGGPGGPGDGPGFGPPPGFEGGPDGPARQQP